LEETKEIKKVRGEKKRMVKTKSDEAIPKKDEEEVKCKEVATEEETDETKAVDEEEDTEEKSEDLEDEETKEEDLTEEEKKKRKAKRMKGEMGGENPKEDTASATDANSTITTGNVIGTAQHVLTPNSGIAGTRNASGNEPSNTTYSGKSANTDLNKSPLFIELSKQMTGLDKAIKAKIEALEKSMSDRIANAQKALNKIEKFYSQPFYKAIDESVSPEATMHKSIEEQIKAGKVQFTD
jgi:hypothetical protein